MQGTSFSPRLTARSLLILAACAGSLGQLGCAGRAPRPDGPYREAQEFVDALSDLAVDCTREFAPAESTGQVVVAADLSLPGKAPLILDGGSSDGTDSILVCVRDRATESLRSPGSSPARPPCGCDS